MPKINSPDLVASAPDRTLLPGRRPALSGIQRSVIGNGERGERSRKQRAATGGDGFFTKSCRVPLTDCILPRTVYRESRQPGKSFRVSGPYPWCTAQPRCRPCSACHKAGAAVGRKTGQLERRQRPRTRDARPALPRPKNSTVLWQFGSATRREGASRSRGGKSQPSRPGGCARLHAQSPSPGHIYRSRLRFVQSILSAKR